MAAILLSVFNFQGLFQAQFPLLSRAVTNPNKISDPDPNPNEVSCRISDPDPMIHKTYIKDNKTC